MLPGCWTSAHVPCTDDTLNSVTKVPSFCNQTMRLVPYVINVQLKFAVESAARSVNVFTCQVSVSCITGCVCAKVCRDIKIRMAVQPDKNSGLMAAGFCSCRGSVSGCSFCHPG